MNSLKCKLAEFEQFQFVATNNKNKLANLYDKGLISFDGEEKE